MKNRVRKSMKNKRKQRLLSRGVCTSLSFPPQLLLSVHALNIGSDCHSLGLTCSSFTVCFLHLICVFVSEGRRSVVEQKSKSFVETAVGSVMYDSSELPGNSWGLQVSAEIMSNLLAISRSCAAYRQNCPNSWFTTTSCS